MSFNGLGLSLGTLSLISDAESRSCSPENPTGAKGQGGRHAEVAGGSARDLGIGWKTRPSVAVAPGQTLTMADLAGPGAIQQIWMTLTGHSRFSILRIYWDGEAAPSVEVPAGDFFASAYTSYQVFAPLNSLAVCVNPGNAFNCYWEMPFRRHCRMTLENIGLEPITAFYQINYALTTVPDEAAYFHAQFRRSNPLGLGEVHTILDQVRGRGHYIGTYLAWQPNSNGWWGEGEIKFYIDGDIPAGTSTNRAIAERGGTCFPTICGTGTEDYFCGSYNFENKTTKKYEEYTTAYAGLSHVVRPDGVYNANTRFSLYRWHILDPVRFQQDLTITIQALGWRVGGRFLQLQDDISSVGFWYQVEPHLAYPTLPERDGLEII